MIGSAQAAEHYEITRYGTLIAWATQLGRDEAIRLLAENLEQEKHADQLLTEIAESTTMEVPPSAGPHPIAHCFGTLASAQLRAIVASSRNADVICVQRATRL
jgi:hypothetical protein